MTLQYSDEQNDRRRTDRAVPVRAGEETFISPVDREAIFRELIRGEVRRGRLHKSARARIVRYASGMGLSPLQAGKLIEQCTDEASRLTQPTETSCEPRLVTRAPASPRTHGMLAYAIIMLAVAIVGILSRG